MTEEASKYEIEPARDVIKLEPPRNQVMTPLDMIGQAVANGAGIEVLEKLMSLHERYDASQAKKAYSAAMAAAKAEIKPIIKNRKVDFTSQKGRTNYDYEDLGGIADAVDPILSKNGLSYRWKSRQEGKSVTITCVLSHRDGYSEDAAELSAANDESGNKNSIQSVGSTATFLQRYTLKLALGLAATKDDDGKAADMGNPITEDQLSELISLADEVEADKQAFCKYLSMKFRREIKGFAQIPASRFEDARKALKKKGEAQ